MSDANPIGTGLPTPPQGLRVLRAFVVLIFLVGCGGCSITGSWKTIAVDPPGLPFPIERMSFDRDHNYTATCLYEGENRTSTGQYRWNGFTLDVMQAGKKQQSYRVRRHLDGKLVLTLGEGDRKVSTIMIKEDPPLPDGASRE